LAFFSAVPVARFAGFSVAKVVPELRNSSTTCQSSPEQDRVDGMAYYRDMAAGYQDFGIQQRVRIYKSESDSGIE